MKLKYIIFSLLAFIGTIGCSDILDKKDLSSVTEKEVWNDASYATAYVNKLYRENLPVWDEKVASNSDESYGSETLMYGELTSESIDIWHYEEIRKMNTFIEKISTGTIDLKTQESLKAQVAVLRAWRYFEMVRVYGGVPMILKAQSLSDDLLVARNKTSESINLIIKDLDFATEFLPWNWKGNDLGRVTKATAIALKARILLYYASPQFNPSNDRQRWKDAYDANKIAKETLKANGYDLHEDFENIWFDEMNKEVIFGKRYEEPKTVHSWDAYTRPMAEAQNGTGANQPALELIHSFPMITGVPINESTDYDPVIYWKNRDPRFKSTIAYNGCTWELSGKTGRKQWTFVGAEPNMPSRTGFYCRKAINLSYTPYFTENSSTDWIELRYAEVLLNFAECATEQNQLDEAYTVLKQIRKRAGIKAGSNEMYGLKAGMNQSAMIDAILLERKIEFAYEGKRYWDLRRRKLFASELNGKKRHGLFPRLKISQEEFDKIKDQVDLDANYATYFENQLEILDKIQNINYKDNYYFFALPNKHLEANSNLKQTQGWSNGTFDPFD